MRPSHVVEHVFPADNIRFARIAAMGEAGFLILDLEDAILSRAKALARSDMIRSLKEIRRTGARGREAQSRKILLVRINGLRTTWAAADFIEGLRPVLSLIDGVVVPKVNGPEDVMAAHRILLALEKDSGRSESSLILEILIETPLAVVSIDAVANALAATGRPCALIFGPLDYLSAIGGPPQAQMRQEVYALHAKKEIVRAAARFGLDAIDGITVQVKDYAATKKDALEAVLLGFNGKWSLHPEQLRAILDADKERPFSKSRMSRHSKSAPVEPYLLDGLKSMADLGKPVLLPEKANVRGSIMARRSCWLSEAGPPPSSVDHVLERVLTIDKVASVNIQEYPATVKSPLALRFRSLDAVAQANRLILAYPSVEEVIYDVARTEKTDEPAQALIVAAAASGVDAIDGPSVPGTERERAREAALMGFVGKVAQSPGQVGLFNEIFSPSPKAVERALKIISHFLDSRPQHRAGSMVYAYEDSGEFRQDLVDAASIRVELRILAAARQARLLSPDQEKSFGAIESLLREESFV